MAEGHISDFVAVYQISYFYKHEGIAEIMVQIQNASKTLGYYS